MREQKGHVFHRYGSLVRPLQARTCLQPDGTVKHVQVCRKLDVETAEVSWPHRERDNLGQFQPRPAPTAQTGGTSDRGSFHRLTD